MGECGYHYIWLNQDTEWTWKLIYADEARMQHITYLRRDKSDTKLSCMVTQTGRELLLLQSSDWRLSSAQPAPAIMPTCALKIIMNPLRGLLMWRKDMIRPEISIRMIGNSC